MNINSEHARLLTRAECKCGYPPWFPEQNRRLPPEYCCDGARIGGVGVVTERGSFAVLFNMLLRWMTPLRHLQTAPR